MDQEEQLKNLKRRILAKKNNIGAILFELQEINKTLIALPSFNELKESVLDLKKEVNQALKKSDHTVDIKTAIKLQQSSLESFLEPYLKRIEQSINLNESEKMIPRTVNNNPEDIILESRPTAVIGEIIQYSGKLYFCIDADTPIYKKVTLK